MHLRNRELLPGAHFSERNFISLGIIRWEVDWFLLLLKTIFEISLLYLFSVSVAPPVLDDMDELEVYGTEAQSGTELASYTFEVHIWYPLSICTIIAGLGV